MPVPDGGLGWVGVGLKKIYVSPGPGALCEREQASDLNGRELKLVGARESSRLPCSRQCRVLE